MKLCVFTTLAAIAVLVAHVQAYTYRGRMDTSSGFCVGENYGRIPVGGYGYDDEKCEKIFCVAGGINGHGCSPAQVMPGCFLVARPGHYPNCCRNHVVCDDDDDDE
ncbi:unnamed protein product [Larinioides sclopetarius]|uniref:Single domain-containing protein n=1 Tax=Larinioides sclopetarius TaxID=280406 RepID=A0AAV2ALB9_9ARAC